MTKLFWRKPFTVTLAFVMALALPLCGISSLLVAAEDNEIIYQEVEADGGGDDVVYEDIIFADEPDDDEIEENNEPEIADEDNGGQEPAIMPYAEIEDDGEDNAAPDEDIEDGDNEPEQAMYLGEADDENVATPGNTGSEDEENEDNDPEEPQIITIASFTDLDGEITDQRLVLPQEDETPLNLGDIHFPMSLEATDTDGNDITVKLDMWLGEGYDLEAEGEYIFTAKRPDGYALDDGVAMPKITVTVTSSDNAVMPPQTITIAVFAELADEILYQGFDLPAEDAPPLTLEDINFPASLEATDTDENGVTVAVDWHCDDYDLAVMGMYTFTAKLPDGYALGDGVAMPEIIVIVRPADLAIAPMVGTVDENGVETVSVSTWEDLVAEVNAPLSEGATSKVITLTALVTASGTETLDGTGKNITIMRGITGNLFTVGTGASLTLENISIDGDKDGSFSNGGGQLVYINAGGTLTMNSGAKLTKNYTTANHGSGVNNFGTLNMYDGSEISYHSSTNYGSGVALDGSSAVLNMYGGEIKNNNLTSSTSYGGVGVYMRDSSKFNMTGGSISNNQGDSSANGVGVYIGNGCTLTMTGGEITNNINVADTYKGGGAHVASGGLLVLGGNAAIKNNTVGGNPNNVNLTSGRYITLSTTTPPNGMYVGVTTTTADGTIVQSGASEVAQYYFLADDSTKKVTYSSGALSIADGTNPTVLEAFKAQIEAFNNNSVDMTINVTEDITLDALQTIGNSGKTLTITGGGTITRGFLDNMFFVSGGTLILQNITVDGGATGTFANGGGSLVIINGGALEMNTGATLQNNTTEIGSGVCVGNGTFTMSGGKIIGNTASEKGGGVYVDSGGTLTLGGTAVISSNTGSNLYLVNGKTITLDSPQSGMNIYVTTATATGVIVESGATEGDENYFKSDDSSKTVVYDNGSIKIGLPALAGSVSIDGMTKYGETLSAQTSGITSSNPGTLTYQWSNGENIGTNSSTYTLTAADVGKTITVTVSAANYSGSLTSAAAEVVGKAMLTVKADDIEISTGNTPNFTASYTGFVGSDTADNVTITGNPTFGCEYTAGSKAGTYDITVNDVSGLSANNYDFVASAETGTLTVTLQSTVTTFAQLKAAVLSYADAASDMTITVGDDITMTERLTLPANSSKTLTITSDSPTRTITRGKTGNLFTVPAGASLILEGITIDGGKNGSFANGGGSLVYVSGTLTMNSGATLQNNKTTGDGGGVYSSGTFTMNGGIISSNEAKNGGGVHVYYGTFNMTGGEIRSNKASTNGGGVYDDYNFTLGGTAIISGNTKSDGTTASNVYLASGKYITLLSNIDTDKMNIGVTHADSGDVAITSGEAATAEIAACFTSDVDTRYISVSADNKLQLSDRINISGAVVTHSALTYNGMAQIPESFTVKDGETTLTEDTDYTLSAVTPQTNAGTHESAATITGIGKYTGTANVSVTIGQRDLDDVTITAIEALTYNGAAQEPTPSVSDGDITISENDYTVSYSGNKNVADTSLVILTGKGNYTGTTSAEFEITKKDLTITAEDYGVKFGDAVPAQSVYSVTYSGFVGDDDEDTADIFSGTLSFATNYTQGSAVGGSYYIRPSGLTSANYAITYADGALTVGKGNQADLVITGAPTEAITYGDSGFVLSTGNSGSGGGAVTYEVTSGTAVSVDENTGAVTIIGAGSATITATKAEDDSYVAKSATVDITVAKAALTVTADDTSVHYSDDVPPFTVTYSRFVNNDDEGDLGGVLDFDCAYTTTSPVGTYDIWPKGLTSDNYDINFVKGTLTVNKTAQDTLTITGGDITKTWGDAAFDISATGGSGGGDVAYSITSGGDVISISGKTVTILKAGTATVTATKAEDDNYEQTTSAAITITVNKAEQGALTIDGGNIEKTYGDIAFTLSTGDSGDGDGAVSFASSDTDVVSISGSTATIHKAGEVTVTATKAASTNYKAATSDPVTITVDQRDITGEDITVTVADGTYIYKGEAHTPSYTVTDSGAVITDDDYTVTYSDNVNAGTGATITISATDDGNYTGETSATFTIVPAALTITAKSFELTYGDDAPNLASFGELNVTVSGLKGSDQLSDFGGTLVFAYDIINSSEYLKGSDTGKYYIDPSGLSSNNYTITYLNGTLTVKKAQQDTLIITDPGTIIWGDDDFDLSTGNTGSGGGDVTFEVTDGGDVISIDGNTVTILKAGAATVTATKAASTNYLEATDDVEITVNPRDITGEDITVTVTGPHTYTGLQQKPTFTVSDSGATITSNDYDVTYGENKNVSTGGSITIDGKGNYTGQITKSFAITKATLTVTAENKTVSYGAEIPAYTYTITGYMNNETASVITGSPTLSCSYIKGYSVGGYFIDVDVSGLAAANYSFTDSSGRLTVQTTSGAAVSAAPAVAMKTAASITVNAVENAAEAEQLALIPEGIEGSAQSVEYAINTTETAPTAASDWQESTTFTELAQSTTYYAFARTAANNNYYAGIPQMSAAIETDGLYTVQFAVTNSGAASGSTIKATYDGAEILSGTIVQGGKTLVLTASGKGASTYSYSWTVGGESSGTTASITIENLSKSVNATCTVSGTATSSSRESSSSREESSSQAESSAVEESSSQAESSTAESSASSSEAEHPASSVSEASSTAESSSEAAAESSASETAAESSAAESAAESARAAESNSERDNSRDSDSDKSRSDSDSGRETPKEPETVAEAIKEVSEKVGAVVNEMFSGTRTPVGPAMDLTLDVDIGSAVYGRGIMLNAKGLKPFTEIKVTVYSEPQILGVQTADENGEASLWAVFPEELEEGIHTVIAEGIGTLEEPVQSVSMVQIDGKGIVLKLMESSQVLEPIAPGDKSLVRAMEAGKPIYDPARNPGTVAGATLAICVTGGGLAAMAGLRKPGKHSKNREERRSNDSEGLGDGGFLWRILPFRAASDSFSIAIQEATSKISFTLHRFVSDGVWSRAMFGSGGFLLWIFGAGLGYYASMQVGFKALPPEFSIVLAIVALGFLDAGAGFAAWLTIALCAVCAGHVAGLDDVCTLLGMFTLFAALMTLSGSRPLRREYESGKKFIFDRVMDYIIPTVYLMLASSAILNVINGLSGLELFSEENGRTIKIVSVIALWVRLALEDIAINLFPRRYSQVFADAEIKQSIPLILGAIALYISMFVIVSIPFFGFGMMLMFLLALDIVPSLLMYAEDHLPNSKFLSKWYPGADSTYASLVITIIGVFLTLQLMTGTTDYRQMSVAMVILAIPTAVAEIPSLFGREEFTGYGWIRRLTEVGCWALFALISLDIIKLV